jgi:hypothetical protein
MAHSTEHHSAAQQQELDQLIAEAAAATGILPTIDECRRLRDALRPAIGRLANQVRRQQDHLARGTVDWQKREAALLRAQGALCGSLGLGLRSAALHVSVLGEAARALDDCIRGAG